MMENETLYNVNYSRSTNSSLSSADMDSEKKEATVSCVKPMEQTPIWAMVSMTLIFAITALIIIFKLYALSNDDVNKINNNNNNQEDQGLEYHLRRAEVSSSIQFCIGNIPTASVANAFVLHFLCLSEDSSFVWGYLKVIKEEYGFLAEPDDDEAIEIDIPLQNQDEDNLDEDEPNPYETEIISLPSGNISYAIGDALCSAEQIEMAILLDETLVTAESSVNTGQLTGQLPASAAQVIDESPTRDEKVSGESSTSAGQLNSESSASAVQVTDESFVNTGQVKTATDTSVGCNNARDCVSLHEDDYYTSDSVTTTNRSIINTGASLDPCLHAGMVSSGFVPNESIEHTQDGFSYVTDNAPHKL